MYFGQKEKTFVRKSFSRAEKLALGYFRLDPGEWNQLIYDVKTLEQLQNHEVNEESFAHLCKYAGREEDTRTPSENYHFYRICLQDNRILDAVNRSSSFIKLFPLMLYIATHELVHILRFDRGECDFQMPPEERKNEEEKVHRITQNILKPVRDAEIDLVLECFSDDYLIGRAFN